MKINLERNQKGAMGFALIAPIFGLAAIIFMIMREAYQAKKCKIKLEWDDIMCYSVVMIPGLILHFLIILEMIKKIKG